ncbi:MAG: aminoacyl-tRNA hydrolase [candidate division WOR-3 bacterium]|jgi:PTH1 family peptidyl-tRNA hydrolase
MIIFGLGNPGLRYRFTRHNAGFVFVERFAKHHGGRFLRRKHYAISQVDVGGVAVRLVKPKCWMNHCGDVIKWILQKYNEDFLVTVDDINLPVGRVRLRSKGSDGGHLGLRSLINAIQTERFPRLRIGVGRPEIDAAEYVLRRFTPNERKVLLSVVKETIEGVHVMITEGFGKAQNHINSIDIRDME